ncbi:MAG: hypothetical protein JWM08_2224 [Candidatus Angelobacter sp.]|nr:hypothetical protein [Candidatus Angelobacter sp.]
MSNVISLILGAGIGFGTTQLKERLDRKRTKTAFVTAVRYELLTVQKHLDRTLSEISVSQQRLQSGFAPHIVVRFSTNVFDSQLAKLSSLADPLILRLVSFYSTLGILEDIATSINKESDRFVESTGPDRMSCEDRVKSTLLVAREEVMKYERILEELLPDLPQGKLLQ